MMAPIKIEKNNMKPVAGRITVVKLESTSLFIDIIRPPQLQKFLRRQVFHPYQRQVFVGKQSME